MLDPESMSDKDVLVEIWRSLQAIRLILIGFALAAVVGALVVLSLTG